MVPSKKLAADECLKLAEMALMVPWAADGDRDRVLSAFQSSEPVTAASRRKKQQHYNTIHMYLTEHMWDAMMDPDVQKDTKLNALVTHCFKLGMRNPTEPSMKLICSLWLMCCHSNGDLSRMSSVSKSLYLKTVKQNIENQRRRSHDPPSWVEVLPGNPMELMRDNAITFRLAFPTESLPIAPKISIDMIMCFDSSYSCRGGLRNQVPFGSPLRLGPSGSSSGGSGLGNGLNLENLIVGFMQSMQSSNTQMLQLMTNPQTPSPSAKVTSLAAIEDRCRQPLALPGLTRSRTAPLFEELPDSPPSAVAKAPSASAVVTSSGPIAHEVLPAPAAAAATEADDDNDKGVGGANVDVLNLFGALQDRKAASKAKAKAKATAKADSDDTDNEPSSPAAAPAMPMKKAKVSEHVKVGTAMKGGAAPKSEKKAKEGELVQAGKVKAVKGGETAKVVASKTEKYAKKPSLTPSEKARLEKAKSSGHKRKLRASDGYGCSKCRWVFRGCAACKASDFTGFRWNPQMP